MIFRLSGKCPAEALGGFVDMGRCLKYRGERRPLPSSLRSTGMNHLCVKSIIGFILHPLLLASVNPEKKGSGNILPFFFVKRN
jgi:hypothetical protein